MLSRVRSGGGSGVPPAPGRGVESEGMGVKDLSPTGRQNMRSRGVPGLRPGGVRSRLPEKVELRVCPRCPATRHWIIDGLVRHFHITGNNRDLIDTVVSSYRKLLDKVARLPLD